MDEQMVKIYASSVGVWHKHLIRLGSLIAVKDADVRRVVMAADSTAIQNKQHKMLL